MLFPPWMCVGSYGPHVSVLQTYLHGAGFGAGIQFDRYFGNVTGDSLSAWKVVNEIKLADSSLDSEAMRFMREVKGYDFEAACRAVQGTTKFVQPDGSKILWSPDEYEIIRASDLRQGDIFMTSDSRRHLRRLVGNVGIGLEYGVESFVVVPGDVATFWRLVRSVAERHAW